MKMSRGNINVLKKGVSDFLCMLKSTAIVIICVYRPFRKPIVYQGFNRYCSFANSGLLGGGGGMIP